MTEESPCANSNRQFVPSPTPEIVSSLTLTNNFVPLPSRERGFIFRNKLFNHSPVQLFNSPHASRLTFYPSPEFVSSHLLTNKFYPLPQGERGFFCSKPFNLSPVQLFNPPHPSPFTLHFTVCPLTLTLSHSAYSLTRLILRRFELASRREREFIV